jgi:YbbR domain-containing protein
VNALTRHWELKLLALAFAVALWLFVMTSEKSDMILSASIEVGGLAPGLVVAGEQPETVDVQLHGLRVSLARLVPDQLRARLDLAGAGPGEVTVRVLPEHITVPRGITVLRINPSRIRLVLSEAPPPRRAPVSGGATRS